MIPGKILRFLQQRANVAFAGTRDHNLAPHGHRVCGWHIDADRGRLTALIPGVSTPHLLESLEDNGQIAVTIEETPSHETYQFKGRYVGHRPIRDDDIEVAARVRERFVKSLRPIFTDLPEAALRGFVLQPELAVELDVLEVYLQTPGPGAGVRLVPPAEE